MVSDKRLVLRAKIEKMANRVATVVIVGALCLSLGTLLYILALQPRTPENLR
jgi:hypothetical protein